MRETSSSSSSSSSSSPNLSAGGSCGLVTGRSSSPWFLVVVVLVPLLLVSLAVFGVDFKSSASWFSFSSSSSSSTSLLDPTPIPDDVGSGISKEEHEKVDAEGLVGGGGELVLISNTSSGHEGSPVSGQLLVPSPGPAPQPDSKLEHVVSPPRAKRRDIKLEKLELGLEKARGAIREARQNPKHEFQQDADYVPQGPIYKNAYAFQRSYLEMEKLFRVYVYKEGKPPLFHVGRYWNLYASEGRFIRNMEMEKQLRTTNPDRAHVFFLPFSVANMVVNIYKPNSYDLSPMKQTVEDYIKVIAGKYAYWNRSVGADHFMLSCHDWGPLISAVVPELYSNSIRVLCNANTSEGFNPLKDATLPEIRLTRHLKIRISPRPPASNRPFLAFFAGGNHGWVRPTLIKHWMGKDSDMQIHEYLPKGVSYQDMMKNSKFCVCPSGYEVASPRIVEAISLDCVPVIISINYVLPFSDVLDWKSFSVTIEMKDIPDLKKILMSISSRQYMMMQKRVRQVQRHFVVNTPPKRYDVFHMILHSIWLRRLNVRLLTK